MCYLYSSIPTLTNTVGCATCTGPVTITTETVITTGTVPVTIPEVIIGTPLSVTASSSYGIIKSSAYFSNSSVESTVLFVSSSVNGDGYSHSESIVSFTNSFSSVPIFSTRIPQYSTIDSELTIVSQVGTTVVTETQTVSCSTSESSVSVNSGYFTGVVSTEEDASSINVSSETYTEMVSVSKEGITTQTSTAAGEKPKTTLSSLSTGQTESTDIPAEYTGGSLGKRASGIFKSFSVIVCVILFI
ncbi:unnamed protein product [[Candida] boidinii]|uniref:Unnamed protein product n=1 Tax=Candida boidinii TaxID=5477 RepID=A0ACB5TTM4_CANBO|nr:unnamed protein product [[Candida] boidinii]